MRRGGSLLALLALALTGCATATYAPTNTLAADTPVPQAARDAPTTAKALGVAAGPDFDRLGVDAAMAARALSVFRLSCPLLVKRTDGSGLTRPDEWQAACAAAQTTAEGQAQSFFQTYLDVVQVGDGQALATGYFEPEIDGSRVPAPGYTVPIYRRPADLITADLGLFSAALKGKQVRGRVLGGRFVPYADRADIMAGALAGRGLELAWAADPFEFFFLQVQGSGRLRLPDGTVMRIGYDGQNGRAYTAIGKALIDKGLIDPSHASMADILAWLRAHPDQASDILNLNQSWVFFRELSGPGPVGALGVPVTAQASVAVDPQFVPLGAPVFLKTQIAGANGLWVAQDTGGAIKGANRFDTFWGAGVTARDIAGRLVARGTAYVLLPKDSLARLKAEGSYAHAPSQP